MCFIYCSFTCEVNAKEKNIYALHQSNSFCLKHRKVKLINHHENGTWNTGFIQMSLWHKQVFLDISNIYFHETLLFSGAINIYYVDIPFCLQNQHLTYYGENKMFNRLKFKI